MVVNCENVWRAISDYLEGDVSPELRAAMEVHFKECKHCMAVLDGTKNVVQLYGDDHLFELPAGFDARLRQRLAHTTQSVQARSSGRMWLMAVAAVALIVGGYSLTKPSGLLLAPLFSKHAVEPIPADLMVALSDDEKTFHVPGCAYLHTRGNEPPKLIAAAEAVKEGYLPCVHCLRKYVAH